MSIYFVQLKQVKKHLKVHLIQIIYNSSSNMQLSIRKHHIPFTIKYIILKFIITVLSTLLKVR